MAETVQRQIRRITQKELKKLKKSLSKINPDPMGRAIVKEMKDMIGKGISPIRGKGRFPGYKDSYKKRIKKQRGEFKGKRQRPVNLKLTGDMLDALKHKSKKGKRAKLEIGYFDEDEAIKERGHREGANKQLKRPTVPLQRREQFAARIQRIIRLEVDKIIKKLQQ